MAVIGNSTIFIGNSDWFRGDPESITPTTILDPDTMRSMVGGFFRLDGSASNTSDELDVIYYKWEAEEAPLSGRMQLGPLFPQEAIYWDKPQLRVEIDSVGLYRISLTIWAANGGRGSTEYSFVLSLPSDMPLHDNIALDTSWVWRTLPSFWANLPQEDRLKAEILWRGITQQLGKDLISAYDLDNNKSIATAQDKVYSRWHPVSLDIDIRGSSIRVNRRRSAAIQQRLSNTTAEVSLDPLTWADLVAERSISFNGVFISPTEVLVEVDSLSEFIPSSKDEGRSIEVDIFGVTIRSTISFVDSQVVGSNIKYKYVLSTPIIASGDSLLTITNDTVHQFNIKRSVGDTLPLPVTVGGEPNLLTHYNTSTKVASFSKDLPFISLYMQAYPSIILQNADIEGISNQDFVYLELSIPSESKSVSARFKVTGVVATEDISETAFYVMFDTRVSKFTEIAQTFLSMFNQPSDVFSELSETIKSRHFLDSVESSRIDSSNNVLSISTNGRVQQYSVSPIKVTRLSRVLIDSDIINIVKLSEFIEDHDYNIGSRLTEGNRSVTVERPPLQLLENREFKLIDKEVRGAYYRYVEFITEDHLLNTPTKLWAETVIKSNHEALDSIYGTLLSFSHSEWLERGLSVSYKSILSAMMYARVSGPSIHSIQNAVSILSGIPFAEERSRVISIDSTLDPTLIGDRNSYISITLESIDSEDRVTGSIRTYRIIAPSETTLSETTGVTFGSSLVGRLAVGDVVEQFTPLGLGVILEDIVNNHRGMFSEVLDRHRFRARIDTHSSDISTEGDLELLYDFVCDIKPSYVDFVLSLFKYNVDTIEIISRAIVKYRSRFFDNPYLLKGPADILDDEIPGRALHDLPSYTVLSTWFPRDGKVTVNEDGSLDLISESSYFTVESLADGYIVYPGNFVSPLIPHGYTANWINSTIDGGTSMAWIRGVQEIQNSDRNSDVTLPDYVIFRSGIAEGMYRINSVLSSTHLNILPVGPDNVDLAHFEGESIVFAVGRLASEIIFDGIVSEGGDAGIHLIGEGVLHDGIAAGDEMSFPGSTRGRYTVRAVSYLDTDRGEPAIFVNPYGLQLLESELNPNDTDPVRVVVRRPQLACRTSGTLTSAFVVYSLVRADTKYGSYAYSIDQGGIVSPASVGLSVGDRIMSTDNQGIDSYIVGIFGSILWLGYAPDVANSDVKAIRENGLSYGSLDDVDTTLGTNCLIISRSTALARQSWSRRHLSSIVAVVGVSDDLLNVLTLSDALHATSGNPVINSIRPGDMLKIITPLANGPTPTDLASHQFTDGFGLLRVIEVDEDAVTISQPLPLPLSYAGSQFSVKIVREANLSSSYWRIS